MTTTETGNADDAAGSFWTSVSHQQPCLEGSVGQGENQQVQQCQLSQQCTSFFPVACPPNSLRALRLQQDQRDQQAAVRQQQAATPGVPPPLSDPPQPCQPQPAPSSQPKPHTPPQRTPSVSSRSSSNSSSLGVSQSSCSASADSSPTSSSNAVVVTVLHSDDNNSSGSGGSGGQAAGIGVASIYDLYSCRRVYCIMMVVALAALTAPLSNTIFLPAMKAIQLDLHTSAAAVTSSVGTFQVALGLAALLWGPASDRFGRKPILVAATVLFALTNIPLILAPNVGVLLAFRTLQGAAIAAYASAAPGMTADICSPQNRGTLFGVCSVAALLGPVVGPPLGGGLSQAFGWRSMFVLLASLSSLVILPLLLWFVPETLQYKVVQRLSRQQPAAALKVAEAATILDQGPPKFQAPWWPLHIALDRTLILHVLVMLLGYGTYIVTLAVMPFYLARPPYALSTANIGAAYLPGAIAAILASPCGGKLADLAARGNPCQPLRRLVYANLLGLCLMPLGVLLLGWGLQKGLPLALPLLACSVTSFINSLYMPALFTVLTIIKQESSAAAVGGLYALLFLLSGSLMMVGTAVITALGLGPFLTILAALHWACTLAAFVQVVRSCSDGQAALPLISRHGSAAFVRSAYRVVSTSCKSPADFGRGAAHAPAGGAQQEAGGEQTKAAGGSNSGKDADRSGLQAQRHDSEGSGTKPDSACAAAADHV